MRRQPSSRPPTLFLLPGLSVLSTIGSGKGRRPAIATSYFAEHEGWWIEVQSGTVGIYREDNRPRPPDMRTFIEDACAAAGSL